MSDVSTQYQFNVHKFEINTIFTKISFLSCKTIINHRIYKTIQQTLPLICPAAIFCDTQLFNTLISVDPWVDDWLRIGEFSFIIFYYHIHVIYNFFYNSDPKEIIKDLQPWTKCSHYSDDIQRMAIFSGSSDERVSIGDTFQSRDYLYTPLLSFLGNKHCGSKCHAQMVVDACHVGWVLRRRGWSTNISFAFVSCGSQYCHRLLFQR